MVSVLLHVVLAALLLLFRPTATPTVAARPTVFRSIPLAAPLRPPSVPARQLAGGGGGAGERLPASKGRPPRVAPRTFVPPTVHRPVERALLEIEPSVVSAPAVTLPMAAIGDPLASLGPPSNGRGKNGGIGDGDGGGVGPGKGPRAGAGGIGPGGYRLTAGITPPVLVHKVDPGFSEEARRARFRGVVVLRIVIDENGEPKAMEVVQSPGMGLDERALESVAQWRFRPARRAGKAVPVQATVEVNFHLL